MGGAVQIQPDDLAGYLADLTRPAVKKIGDLDSRGAVGLNHRNRRRFQALTVDCRLAGLCHVRKDAADCQAYRLISL